MYYNIIAFDLCKSLELRRRLTVLYAVVNDKSNRFRPLCACVLIACTTGLRFRNVGREFHAANLQENEQGGDKFVTDLSANIEGK